MIVYMVIVVSMGVVTMGHVPMVIMAITVGRSVLMGHVSVVRVVIVVAMVIVPLYRYSHNTPPNLKLDYTLQAII